MKKNKKILTPCDIVAKRNRAMLRALATVRMSHKDPCGICPNVMIALETAAIGGLAGALISDCDPYVTAGMALCGAGVGMVLTDAVYITAVTLIQALMFIYDSSVLVLQLFTKDGRNAAKQDMEKVKAKFNEFKKAIAQSNNRNNIKVK